MNETILGNHRYMNERHTHYAASERSSLGYGDASNEIQLTDIGLSEGTRPDATVDQENGSVVARTPKDRNVEHVYTKYGGTIKPTANATLLLSRFTRCD